MTGPHLTRFILITRSIGIVMPALLKRTSRPPKSDTTLLKAAVKITRMKLRPDTSLLPNQSECVRACVCTSVCIHETYIIIIVIIVIIITAIVIVIIAIIIIIIITSIIIVINITIILIIIILVFVADDGLVILK